MKTFKRIVFVLAAAALLIGCVPLGFAEDLTYGDWKYEIISGGVKITAYTGTKTKVVVPDIIDGKPVTAIAGGAFEESGKGITDLTISKYVEQMSTRLWFRDDFSHSQYSDFALKGMSSLKTLTFADGIQNVPAGAAFGRTSLAKVIIPDSAETIGDEAFRGCAGLTEVVLSPTSYLTGIGVQAFQNCKLLDGFVFPEELKTIGESAFEDAGLESVTFAEGLDSINAYAFKNTRLSSVKLPDSLTSIGCAAFSGTKIRELTVPKNVERMYSYSDIKTGASGTALAGMEHLRTLIFAEGMDKIPSKAASGMISLRKVVIPDSVTEIGSEAFMGCSALTRVVIPDSVTEIGSQAFMGCSALTQVEISPDSRLTIIHEQAFRGCTMLTSIDLPDNNLTTLEYFAFEGSGLTAITIPKTVTVMSTDGASWGASGPALYNMPKLETITFADGIKAIPDNTIGTSCAGLKKICVYDCIEDAGNIADTLKGLTNNPELIVDIRPCAENENDTGDPSGNVYNLGEETYGFENYLDTDSVGHCFGMAATSQGYYLDGIGELEMPDGLGSLYELKSEYDNESVKAEICRYQKIQGKYVNDAVIAGGHFINDFDRTGAMDEWNSVLEAVRDKKYDGSGKLMVGIWSEKDGGHMVSFLYYKEVKGEERIYVYDSNYPDTETYLYAADGKIRQAPYTGFGTPIDCIQLIDVQKYF
ncbi:MAG: leucine-rich repeat domain-containing protein, partial [Clostridia bacterium]|nr:leucine-rich repeat domain-containing protein [Clostridia bacterium]